MNATEWTALTVAAIGAIGAVVLQAMQMYFSYRRDTAMKDKAEEAVKKADAVEKKLDNNTVITTAAKDAAQQAEKQTNGVLTDYREQVDGHDRRIATMEREIGELKLLVGTAIKNVDSTRHEVRNHLQTIMTQLGIIAVAGGKAPPEAK